MPSSTNAWGYLLKRYHSLPRWWSTHPNSVRLTPSSRMNPAQVCQGQAHMASGRLHSLEFRWTGGKPCHIPLHGGGTQLAPSPHLFSTWIRTLQSHNDCVRLTTTGHTSAMGVIVRHSDTRFHSVGWGPPSIWWAGAPLGVNDKLAMGGVKQPPGPYRVSPQS